VQENDPPDDGQKSENREISDEEFLSNVIKIFGKDIVNY